MFNVCTNLSFTYIVRFLRYVVPHDVFQDASKNKLVFTSDSSLVLVTTCRFEEARKHWSCCRLRLLAAAHVLVFCVFLASTMVLVS